MAANERRVIVVGGGLAGLAASVRIAEAGTPVDLFSMVPVKRSHSVCAQGGINACTEPVRQEGFSEWDHFDETLYGGDFLNHQPPVYQMTHWAPRIINLLDRMGVPFNRTMEGRLDRRYFGGSLFRRTHFAGATTGQQLLYSLDEQTRQWENAGRVTKYEFWEVLWPVVDDDGVCRGIVAQDMRTMQIRPFRADAVVMATGGCGLIYGKSTMSVICTGGAASRCYQAGAPLANPEMIQVHPTAIPGEDKCRLMSESARGEGGRVWVPRKKNDNRHPNDIPENERWYFLEEKYPKYKNLVSRDIATREIFNVCQDGYGVGGGNMVYLDVSQLSDDKKNKLAGILEIYEKFVGDDPRKVPMKIFPAVHYSMGGLYTTYTPADDHKGLVEGAPNNMMTPIPGLYAFGEVNYAYHGATRLGANALLSCIFDGLYCGLSVHNYVQDLENPADNAPDSLYQKFVDQETQKADHLIQSKGQNNPYELHKRLGAELTAAATVVKTEDKLKQAVDAVREIKQQYQDIRLTDTGNWTNQNLSFARALGDMIKYGEAILLASIERKESRGSHYRPDFPDRNDDQFLKTSIVRYNQAEDRPMIEWEDVPTPLVQPRVRSYGKTEAQAEQQQKPGGEAYSQRPTEASPAYATETKSHQASAGEEQAGQ